MVEISSEPAVQSRESEIITSPILVHGQRSETLAEHTQHLISIPETESEGNDSFGDKLLREARVLTWGVGGAFGDVVENPLSKLPDAAAAGTFGAGLRALERAGTKGKVMAGVVGAGMLAKMGYDEWRGERWSEFGGAMDAAWESKANFYSSVEATKHSVGSLAVDMTVGSLAYKVSGLRGEPVGSRSNLLNKTELGLSLTNQSHPVPKFTELSLMGERTSRALGEPSTPLRRITQPALTSELTLMGQRSTTALSEASNRRSSLGTNSLDALSGRTHDALRLNSHDLVRARTHDNPAGQSAKKTPEGALSHKGTLTEALANKLVTEHHAGEFGYLSAIREVAAVETAPGFVPTRRAYEAIAETLEQYSKLSDPDFAQKYHAVAELVKLHAQTLSN